MKLEKSERKKLYKLLEEWTRSEIMARLGPFNNLEYAEYHMIMVEKENEIRKLLYGTDNLVTLGLEWKILKKRSKERVTKKLLKSSALSSDSFLDAARKKKIKEKGKKKHGKFKKSEEAILF